MHWHLARVAAHDRAFAMCRASAVCAQRFNALLRRLRGEGVAWDMAHMASSWHLLKGRELHMGAVRLGAALYGQQRIVPGTRPAARWLTRVVRIKKARLFSYVGVLLDVGCRAQGLRWLCAGSFTLCVL